jgi:hypothetical protein
LWSKWGSKIDSEKTPQTVIQVQFTNTEVQTQIKADGKKQQRYLFKQNSFYQFVQIILIVTGPVAKTAS